MQWIEALFTIYNCHIWVVENAEKKIWIKLYQNKHFYGNFNLNFSLQNKQLNIFYYFFHFSERRFLFRCNFLLIFFYFPFFGSFWIYSAYLEILFGQFKFFFSFVEVACFEEKSLNWKFHRSIYYSITIWKFFSLRFQQLKHFFGFGFGSGIFSQFFFLAKLCLSCWKRREKNFHRDIE